MPVMTLCQSNNSIFMA